jgi:NAD+ kinase
VTSPAEDQRRVLVIAHIGRGDAREVALEFCRGLGKHGIVTRLLADEAAELGLAEPDVEIVSADADPAADCEVVVVVGGDGTILRAAELARECGTPLLGINLGHVGFLAEAESDDVESSIDAIVQQRYTAEERLTIDVDVYRDADHSDTGDRGADSGKELVASTWALNEASVEKAARERMLEVVVEIDGRPLSRFGGDGVVCATPTGSTAYNFSAGGPIVWPGVEALLLVPLSAHALFARPLVVAPTSVLAVEVIRRTDGSGVLWCDGRRTVDLPPGARIEVRRGQRPVRLVRLHEAPFTDRLVAKFDLPVEGWRGRAVERIRRHGSQRGGDRA